MMKRDQNLFKRFVSVKIYIIEFLGLLDNKLTLNFFKRPKFWLMVWEAVAELMRESG